jgi:hypothetical protein
MVGIVWYGLLWLIWHVLVLPPNIPLFSHQVQFKSLPIPAAEPDSAEPIFGKNDATPEKLNEERERARKLYHEQLAMVADKKRAAILHDLTAQREESEMLEKIKRE